MLVITKFRSLLVLAFLFPFLAAYAADRVTFETLSRQSDRIIVGTNLGPSGGTATLKDGVIINLGVRDEDGHVFTPYRIRVSQCVFDKESTCKPEETEIFLPGGTVWDASSGEGRYVTTEVARGATLPPQATDLVLFMRKHGTRFTPINDARALITVDRTSGTPKVQLHFSSPALLTSTGQQAALRQSTMGDSRTRPAFAADMPLDQLETLVHRARGQESPAPQER